MSHAPSPAKPSKRRSATYFFLRGLAIVLPPVVTLLILLWLANGFNAYVIQPINMVVRYAVAQMMADIRKPADLEAAQAPYFPDLPGWRRNYRVTKALRDEAEELAQVGQKLTREQLDSERYDRQVFVPIGRPASPTDYVPLEDYEFVFEQLRPQPLPATAIGLYMELAAGSRRFVVWQMTTLGLLLAIVGLYFLGRFVTARIGAWFVHKFELFLTQVPLVRNVYSTVKQVTDFVLSDREVEFQRVVAVEYPRVGSWTVGFVTGEGMLQIAGETGEAMLTVLIPTSPMPAGGFTIMVPRSQTIDLDLTVDQAAQFVFSCGVLTPPQQRTTPERLEEHLQQRLGSEGLVATGTAAEGAARREAGTGS